MIGELDFDVRTIGRASTVLDVAVVREIRKSDLELLQVERGTKPQPIAKIRDRHHGLARCLAQGMKDQEASAITGYSPSRISILKSDPTFEELVSFYKENETSSFAEFVQRATTVTLSAMNEIADRLEEIPENFSVGQLLEVSKTFADRIGHAPVQRNITANVNVELGARLASARARVAKMLEAQIPVIETSFIEVAA